MCTTHVHLPFPRNATVDGPDSHPFRPAVPPTLPDVEAGTDLGGPPERSRLGTRWPASLPEPRIAGPGIRAFENTYTSPYSSANTARSPLYTPDLFDSQASLVI
jgi:hypothetical protein